MYLGLDPTRFTTSKELVHYPVITIEPRAYDQKLLQARECDVLLFTSRVAVTLFFSNFIMKESEYNKKLYLVVGKATAQLLPHSVSAFPECAEGMVLLLESFCSILKGRKIFYPHSAEARPLIQQTLQRLNFSFVEVVTYAPKVTEAALPDLEEFDEIVFTSPSTVRAFFSKNPSLLHRPELTTMGPITHNALIAEKERMRNC